MAKNGGDRYPKLLKIHRLGVFYMAFSGYFFLEWLSRRTWFVKHNYRFNKSPEGFSRDKTTGSVLAQTIGLSMMGAMMWTMLTPIGHCRLCGFYVLLSILPILFWRPSGLCQEDKAGMMPTSKRKMNDKRWKQPKMFDKPPNGLLGFKLLSQKFSMRLSFRSFCHKLYNVCFAPHKHSAKNRA